MDVKPITVLIRVEGIIFSEGRIVLVQEKDKDGWRLPGGEIAKVNFLDWEVDRLINEETRLRFSHNQYEYFVYLQRIRSQELESEIEDEKGKITVEGLMDEWQRLDGELKLLNGEFWRFFKQKTISVLEEKKQAAFFEIVSALKEENRGLRKKITQAADGIITVAFFGQLIEFKPICGEGIRKIDLFRIKEIFLKDKIFKLSGSTLKAIQHACEFLGCVI